MTYQELLEVQTQAGDVRFVDVNINDPDLPKSGFVKVARGLKAKVMGRVDDGLGNICTTVRLELRKVNAWLQAERRVAGLAYKADTAPTKLVRKWRHEFKLMARYVTQAKEKGEPITHILWNHQAPPAPALVELLRAHPEVKMVRSNTMLPNDLKYLTTPEFDRLRTLSLEKRGEPLEFQDEPKAAIAP